MNKERKTMLTAKWDAERKLYVCYPFLAATWTSPDGNNWSDTRGPVVGDVFKAATITLEGGPRNGVVVS